MFFGGTVFILDNLIIFKTVHWKEHSPVRRAIGWIAAFLHFLIMPIITWVITLKNFKTEAACSVTSCKSLCDGSSETEGCCSCSILRKTHEAPVGNERIGNTLEMYQSKRGRQNRSEKINPPIRERLATENRNTRCYCTLGRCLLIFLHVLAPLLYTTVAGSAIALSIEDSQNTTGRCLNDTSTCQWYYREYFYNTALFYGFNTIGTILAIVFSIQTYLNHAYKYAYLRLKLQQENFDIRNNAIEEFIKIVHYNFCEITSEDKTKLWRANFFSGSFITNLIFYDIAYIILMSIERKLDSTPRALIVIFLGLSGLVLLGFMVYMNNQIDNTKNTLLYLQSHQNLTHPDALNSTTASTDRTNGNQVSMLQTIVNYFDSYAHIFGFVPKIGTLIVATLTLVVQKVVPFILESDGILS
jgi:hypothetical protein